jgi:hypothetical protein
MNDRKNPVIWVRFRSGGFSQVEVEFLDKKRKFLRILRILSVYKKKGQDPFDEERIKEAEKQVLANIYRIEEFVRVDPKALKKSGIDPRGEEVYPICYVEDIEKLYKKENRPPKTLVLPSRFTDDNL